MFAIPYKGPLMLLVVRLDYHHSYVGVLSKVLLIFHQVGLFVEYHKGIRKGSKYARVHHLVLKCILYIFGIFKGQPLLFR
jgi:hypothetical protein